MRGLIAALGLELVAEVADEAAVELEGEVWNLGGPEYLQALLQTVEERLVLANFVADHLRERPRGVAHEGEAGTGAGAAAVEPERMLAFAEKSDEGGLGVGKEVELHHG